VVVRSKLQCALFTRLSLEIVVNDAKFLTSHDGQYVDGDSELL
jgi:hypothetical protein